MKIVTFGIATLDDVKRHVADAFRGKRQDARISFASPELLFSLMTPKRWEILRAIGGEGPMSIREAARQVGLLQSGVIAYRAVDSFGNKPNVDHCVHAVTDAEPTLAHCKQPIHRIGRTGTAELVERYIRAGAFDPSVRHDWLLPALGLRSCGPACREN